MNLNIVSEWNEREGVGYKEGLERSKPGISKRRKVEGQLTLFAFIHHCQISAFPVNTHGKYKPVLTVNCDDTS
jgi:hypothetical protein